MNVENIENLPEANGWEAYDGEGAVVRKRHLSQGTVTVMRRTEDGSWIWWVDLKGHKANAQGVEPHQARAKYRAMLVYLAMTREVAT